MYTYNLIKWINNISDTSLKAKNPFEYSRNACNELYINYKKDSNIVKKSIKYYEDREKFNNTIKPSINKFIKSVKKMFEPLNYNITYMPMSSYPKLNLPNDSDFDLGVLVKNFDTEKMFNLTKVLCENGYKFEKVTKNKGNPGGEAYRYSIMYEGIDCEIKIRNLDKCKILVSMHAVLNSLSKNESIFWTYHKHLVKEWSKTNDKYTYELFKMIMFHNYLYKIRGAFILIPG